MAEEDPDATFLQQLYADSEEYTQKQQEESLKEYEPANIPGLQTILPTGTIIAEKYTIYRRIRSPTTFLCDRIGLGVCELKIACDPEGQNMVFRELLVWAELEMFMPLLYLNPPINDPTLDVRTLSFQSVGYSIRKLVECYNVFPLGASLLFALDSLCAVKQLHDHGFVHRNISPKSFCMGLKKGGTEDHIVYLTNLGQADRWIKGNGLNELPPCGDNFQVDEVFSSPDVYEGQPVTRRDDLFSWFFTVLYTRRANFCRNGEREISQQFKRQMDPVKIVATFGLLAGPEMATILTYLRWMNPGSKPDYEFIFDCIVTALEAVFHNAIPPSLPEDPNLYNCLKSYHLAPKKAESSEAMGARRAIIERVPVFTTPEDTEDVVGFASAEDILAEYRGKIMGREERQVFKMCENLIVEEPNFQPFAQFETKE